MNFITSLPILTNCKGNNYNFILVIVDWLIKMIDYKLVKVIINASRPTQVIINVVIYQQLFETQLFQIEAFCSTRNSNHCSAISLALNRSYSPYPTLRLTVRLSSKTAL